MCGIFAVISDNLDNLDLNKFSNSLNIIKYRGPDKTNIKKVSKNIVFGHNRLKIIDLNDRSNQPFQDDKYSLLFNGCIYNYREIREELKIKYNFKTQGDTEVLFYALIEWGENALQKIDGMYAFIFYDGTKILASVDKFGEKPLYYFKNKEQIIFSSEIEPIKLYLENKIEVDYSHETFKEFLYLGYLNNDKTIYKNIKKILPKNNYIVKENKIITKLKENKVIDSSNVSIDDIHDELTRSIKRRLIADQNIGLLLSTGIDSVLLLTLIKKEINFDIETFSFFKTEDKLNINYIKELNNYLGVNTKIINNLDTEYKVNDFRKIFSDLNDCETYFPYFAMIKHISCNTDIKVILSGSGGDEIFFGYNKYKFVYDKKKFYKFFRGIKKIPKNNFLKKIAFFIGSDEEKFIKIKNNKPFFEDDKIKKIINFNKDKELYETIRNYDIENTLPFSLIPALERASMRNSIENRSPYLSTQLLNLVDNFNNFELILKTQKNIQNEILKRYIPDKLLPKNKIGFFSPLKMKTDYDKIKLYLKKINYNYSDINERDIQRIAIYDNFINSI